MKPYLIVAAVSAAVSLLTTPLVRRIAIRLHVVDVPDDERKVHGDAMPYLGGVALYLALLAGVGAAWRLGAFRELFETSTEALGVLVAATGVVVLGALDDRFGYRASTKLAGQIAAAGVLALAGVQLFYFWLPGVGLVSLSTDLSALLTIAWTVAIINAMNLIDGLDGLAAGVATIAAGSFFAYAYQAADGQASTAALLSAIVVGACLGFLRYNFNPARIFMGDAGSMLLGLLLASATVSGVGRTTEPEFADVAGLIVPVLLPALVLAIPLADAGWAILRRVRGRAPVFHPDKRHIHHRLLDMASSHRRAVLVMYLWSGLMAGIALALAFDDGTVGRAVAAGLGATLFGTVLVLPRVLRRGGRVADPRDSIHNQPGTVGET